MNSAADKSKSIGFFKTKKSGLGLDCFALEVVVVVAFGSLMVKQVTSKNGNMMKAAILTVHPNDNLKIDP
jgi:hypothetical protein